MSSELIDFHALDGELAELKSATHWYLGFSGGVDSTVLLHLLTRWRRAHPEAPPLTAIHINHQMQSASDDWQVHCEWVGKMLGVPVSCHQVTVESGSGGSEAAAREARYRVFEELLQEGEVLFLGHHLDDQVETFFLRLLRGAGVQGLAAIPACRSLGRGRLVRPLMQLTREQLQAYADSHGLSCIEDPSNRDTAMDRNFLRAELLPLLASRWPGYRRTVNRASEHMAVAASALDELLPAPETVYSTLGDPGVALAALDGSREAAAIKLRSWLQASGLPPPDQTALEEFLRQLREAGQDAGPRLQCSAYTLQRYRDAVFRLPEGEEGLSPQPVSICPGDIYDVPGVGRLALEPTDGPGLALEEGEALTLFWRRGGERCRPVGRGGSNSLKKLLQEADIPPWWRERVPLLSSGDELLAVGDLWMCESARYRGGARSGENLWCLHWQRGLEAAGD
ncbi:MAG: tRNA lysidine(34) synthetase TilS [Haliea sp.]|jgi:tRNA(Ile)-lysidine synthase|nr:tRNA lysidine(34) synthetase TilS [Haliea sp.]